MTDNELLEVFDAHGRLIGVKPRRQVHQDGDWHLLVFVWAARSLPNGTTRFMLQARSRPDDPYRGQLDALAGGHVTAGETHLQSAIRECREELGLHLREDELLHLGTRSLENPEGICQRVIEHFYLCQRPLCLGDVDFTREANGFVEVDIDEFADLIDHKREVITGRARILGEGGSDQAMEVSRDFMSKYSDGIIDIFRQSIKAVRMAMTSNRVDPAIWR